MNGKDFHRIIESYADLIEEVSTAHGAATYRAIASIFHVAPRESVAVTCKKLQQVGASTIGDGGEIQEFLGVAPFIKACFEATAKKAVIDDFGRLLNVLPPFAGMSVERLTEALRTQSRARVKAKRQPAASLSEEGILEYVQRLSHAMGHEQAFGEVFTALKKDPAVKAPIAKQIARAFAKKAGRTKAEALSLIWARHASIVGARARADATGGRTAG